MDLRYFFKNEIDLIAVGETEDLKYSPIFSGANLSEKIWFPT